jgi:hypothetical protein
MQVSNDLRPLTIKKILTQEIQFFDKIYFKDRNYPHIRIYYSGHGEKDYLKLSSEHNFEYKQHFIDHVATKINSWTKSLEIESKAYWNMSLYLDACHSGSALHAGKEWL